VPTWAWVVMGLEALAIVGLIVMIVRERDMRQLAEQRMADRGSYGASPGYGGQGSEYDRPEWEPGGGQPPGPGGPPSGPPNRPRP
jgi:hypothetical protein